MEKEENKKWEEQDKMREKKEGNGNGDKRRKYMVESGHDRDLKLPQLQLNHKKITKCDIL